MNYFLVSGYNLTSEPLRPELDMLALNPRKRRHRVIQEINDADAENMPILTDAQLETLNSELSHNGEARKVCNY